MKGIRLSAQSIKRTLLRCMPDFFLLSYHFIFATFALVIWRFPSRRLVVIGITGTKGKTSTSIFLHAALSATGEKVGLLSTVETRVGDAVYPNVRHMTMPGRGFVQKRLRAMVDAGCTYAVVEVPSEGMRQFRDFGVWYDSVIFTNLSPEHLVTHKTFENYRATKGRLFKRHARSRQKVIGGKPVPRFVLLNADDKHTAYFQDCSRSFKGKQILFGLSENADSDARASVTETAGGCSFSLGGEQYTAPLPGEITVRNMLPAILLATHYCGASAEVLQRALNSVVLPGRLERIDEGQPFNVFCDYAHEPLSMVGAYDALKGYATNGGRVIMVIGAVGASRWRYNAEEIGEVVGARADLTIITDIDPFFDNPLEIIEAVATGVKKNTGAKLRVEPDRRKAIYDAISAAEDNDVVIITGKGAEFTTEVRGKSLPWDERKVIREEIQRSMKGNSDTAADI